MPVPESGFPFAFHPGSLCLFGDLGCHNLEQMPGQTLQMLGVELVTEPDHRGLCLLDSLGRDIVGEPAQHLGHGPGLMLIDPPVPERFANLIEAFKIGRVMHHRRCL